MAEKTKPLTDEEIQVLRSFAEGHMLWKRVGERLVRKGGKWKLVATTIILIGSLWLVLEDAIARGGDVLSWLSNRGGD